MVAAEKKSKCLNEIKSWDTAAITKDLIRTLGHCMKNLAVRAVITCDHTLFSRFSFRYLGAYCGLPFL